MFIFVLNLFFIFLLGAIFGSFLNVVSLRHNTGRNIMGRSSCLSCGDNLKWYNLIPVFSFLFQRGRCSTCKTVLSRQYILAEVLVGVLFVLGFIFFQTNLFGFFFYIIFVSLGTILALYDYRHQILPDRFIIPLIVLSFLSLFVSQGFPGASYFYLPSLGLFFYFPTLLAFFSGPLVALPFFVLWLASKGRSFGLGDVKLMMAIGWHMGFLLGFVSVMLAFWIGTASVFIIIFSRMFSNPGKKFNWKIVKNQAVSFGPFLLLGWVVVYFFSGNLINLYLYYV